MGLEGAGEAGMLDKRSRRVVSPPAVTVTCHRGTSQTNGRPAFMFRGKY